MTEEIRVTKYSAFKTFLLCAFALVAVRAHAETFTGTATVKPAAGAEASAPLTATVRTFASDSERDALMAAIKKSEAAARDLLAKKPDVGSIEVAGKATPIKYAYSHPVGAGRLITIVTAEPIHFVVGAHPDTKAKAGHELGVLLIDLSSKPAHGEVALAAKVHIDAQGAIVIDDYGDDVVRLSNVSSK
jgi:hypothetical protein